MRLLRRRLGELDTGRFIGRAAERVTVPEVLEMVRADCKLNDRRSLSRLERGFRFLVAELEQDAALDVTADRLADYVETRRGEGAALASIQYEIASLRRGFKLALQRKRLPYMPPPSPQSGYRTRGKDFGSGRISSGSANIYLNRSAISARSAI